MDMQLAGKTILITGASRGIGAGLADAFAREGCGLRLVSRSAAALDALRQELHARHGVPIETLALDLASRGAPKALVQAFGDIDVLVNNAGAIPGGDLWRVDPGRWREGWDLKVMGYIDITREFYARMRERGQGVILNNIGSGGETFDFNYIAGTSGNAALMAFTRALGGRSLQHGIRVMGVNPGPVSTPRIIQLMRTRAEELYGDPEQYTRLFEKLPLGRPAHVHEIADLFVFLASPRSAYTSGTIFTVDGGMASNQAVG